METEEKTTPSAPEVSMVEQEVVRQMRVLPPGAGAQADCPELGLARNTVRRYLRGGGEAEVQQRPRRTAS